MNSEINAITKAVKDLGISRVLTIGLVCFVCWRLYTIDAYQRKEDIASRIEDREAIGLLTAEVRSLKEPMRDIKNYMFYLCPKDDNSLSLETQGNLMGDEMLLMVEKQ